jgi:hypothetical protein
MSDVTRILYTAVCDHLVSLFAKAPLTDTTLAVDETGVGRPVVDLLDTSRIKADVRPITITAGTKRIPEKASAGRCRRSVWSRRCKYYCKGAG